MIGANNRNEMPMTDDSFDYDRVNKMLEGVWGSIDRSGRSALQIVMLQSLLAGKNVIYYIKEQDKKTLASFLSDFLYLCCQFCKDDDGRLFVKDEKYRHIEYQPDVTLKLICDIFGISERVERSFISSVMPDIEKLLALLCKRGGREFTGRTIKENWPIVNFSNVSYNVNSSAACPHSNAEIKTSFINTHYIDREERKDNDGGIQEFAAHCSDNDIERKRLLQAIAYAISDYRYKNRLFVFESDSDKPLQIIERLLDKVLGSEQIRKIPLHGLLENIDYSNIKVVLSKSCSNKYEVDENDTLSNILGGMDISYFTEEKRQRIYNEIRNDLVVFHLRKLPERFYKSMSAENRKLVTVIKIQASESAEWDKVEARLSKEIDYVASYLIDEVLSELSEGDFNLAESEDLEQGGIFPHNPITQVEMFINDKCTVGTGYKIRRGDLQKAFADYSGTNERNKFYAIMENELGFISTKDVTIHIFEGIDLKR